MRLQVDRENDDQIILCSPKLEELATFITLWTPITSTIQVYRFACSLHVIAIYNVEQARICNSSVR